MSVYVDDAFVSDDPTVWGKWTGGGHMQADTLPELHEFAARIGLRRSWFQTRAGRPDKDHYDLTRARRDQAILLGAIPETVEDGTTRRRAIREALQNAEVALRQEFDQLVTDILVGLDDWTVLMDGPDVDDAREAVMRELVSHARLTHRGRP